MERTTHGLLTIGQFSRLAAISIRMLRHYDQHGLLSPCLVDEFTGYRYYRGDQLGPAQRIRQLRDVGCTVAQIADLLRLVGSPDEFVGVLEAHRAQLIAQAEAAQQRLASLEALLTRVKEHTMFDIDTVTIPAQHRITLRDTIAVYSDEGQLWARLTGALADYADALDPTQPCGATFYDDGYQDRDVDVEVWVVATGPVEVAAPLECRGVDAIDALRVVHHGPYDTIGDACVAVGAEVGRRGLSVTGPMFNRYLVGPADNPDPAAWVTEVCLPVS